MKITKRDYTQTLTDFVNNFEIDMTEAAKIYTPTEHDAIYSAFDKEYSINEWNAAILNYIQTINNTFKQKYNEWLTNKKIIQKGKEQATEIASEEAGKAAGKTISWIIYIIGGVIIFMILFFISKKSKAITPG